ncbi:MAG: serine/threonine-protein kinase, partial [Candidatus Asgardarchaeia archaeon]
LLNLAATYPVLSIKDFSLMYTTSITTAKMFIERLIKNNLINAEIKNDAIIFKRKPVKILQPQIITSKTITEIIPGYKTESIIGTGGFSTVFKAKTKEGKYVAIKVINIVTDEAKKLFIREISFWKPLKHPNIVDMLDYGLDPVPYIVMELMDGTLRDKIKEQKLSKKQIIRIILDIAQALEFAHKEYGLIHKDIKPENILYKGDVYKLSDWGLSGVQQLISKSGYSGTIAYSAPEQFDKKIGAISYWTDVWQLGVVFYELLTGRLPFGTELAEVVKNVLNVEPKRPDDISDELWNLIQGMLQKDPKERLSISDVVKRLRDLLFNM